MTARDPALDLYAMMLAIGHEGDAERPAGVSDDAVAEAVAHWNETLEPLSAAAAPATAPQGLWTRIEASIGSGVRPAAATPVAVRTPLFARLWSSVGAWRLATAAAAAAAVLAVAVLGRPGAPGPAYVAVLQAQDGDRRAGFVVEIAADRTVTLIPLGRTDAGADRSLQFWTLADKAKGPKSLGLVPGDRAVTVPGDALPSIADGQLFEVTLEPLTGSPIGRPTGPILFKGLAARTS